MAHPFMLWCPGPPLSPARTSSPASPLSRPSMAEPVGDLQPWFIAGKRAVPTSALPGTRPPCTQQYTRPPLLVRPSSGCCQSPQLQEMVATQRFSSQILGFLLSPSCQLSPLLSLSPRVSSSRAAECSNIYYVSVQALRCRDAAWRLVLPAVSQTMPDSSRLVCAELCAVTAALL